MKAVLPPSAPNTPKNCRVGSDLRHKKRFPVSCERGTVFRQIVFASARLYAEGAMPTSCSNTLQKYEGS